MKNLLLFISLVVCTNLFANPKQGNWRWRFDNGSETSATWMAPENTPVTIGARQTIRLRTQLFSSMPGVADISLQYASSLNPNVWIDVTNTAGTNAFELAGLSRNITDNTVTTPQLVGCSETVGFTFQGGSVFVSTEVANKTINPNTKSDYEWTITPTNNIQSNVTYMFRVANVEYPMELPSLNTASALPVQLARFSGKAENNKARLQWTTESELNNDYFQVERSTDGITWAAISKVKGSGTTNKPVTYSAYDFAPSNATNLYRITQYDLDGRVKISSVVAVKFASALSMISLYPNPTVKDIRFRLDNIDEKGLTATLVGLDGRVIHRQNIVVNATSNLYQLNLQQKPVPGTYVLNITGTNTSVQEKVIVK